MAENKLVVTKVGLVKLMEATVENPLKLTHFAVGDGNGASIEPVEDMTSLVNEKYRDFISDTYSNGNNLTVECVLKANAPITQGFKIFELGIFDAEGDMIAISQTPEQYRPANSEGVATEWIASVVLQLSNTDNIQIEIPQTVFATVDALQRLNTQFQEFVEQTNKRNRLLVEASVGIDTLFNTNNKYKDQDILTIGVKTWGLSGSIVKISDYPIAFKNCGAVDKGDGTFEIPKMYDGTIRNLPKGNSRNLGTYEADDLKAHLHTVPNHTHTMAHDHDMSHQHYIDQAVGGGNVAKWVLETKNTAWGSNTTNGGRNRTGGSSTTNTGSAGAGNTSSTGGSETRMKNTSGQWYMLLKVDI